MYYRVLLCNTWIVCITGCDNYALDTHIYTAWSTPQSPLQYLQLICAHTMLVQQMEAVGVPVIVGEWSLATGDCSDAWCYVCSQNNHSLLGVECICILSILCVAICDICYTYYTWVCVCM